VLPDSSAADCDAVDTALAGVEAAAAAALLEVEATTFV